MANVQAIPPTTKKYLRSLDLYVFWVRELYEIPGIYAWTDT